MAFSARRGETTISSRHRGCFHRIRILRTNRTSALFLRDVPVAIRTCAATVPDGTCLFDALCASDLSALRCPSVAIMSFFEVGGC